MTSRVCKYYLRGTCKYGARCHFLHEDPYGGSNNSAYNSPNRNTPHHYYNQRNTYAENYATSYTNNYGGDYRNRTGASSLKSNDRYHIDNRRNQNQREEYTSFNPSQMTAADLLDIINMELKQFELGHMWPLTVISAHKELGNIPGFNDYSPEEVRFQYYQSVSHGTVDQFEQTMKQLFSEMVRCCQMFKMKSNEAFNTAKTMLQRPRSTDVPAMSGNSSSSAISGFSFNVNNLPHNKPVHPTNVNVMGGGEAAASNTPLNYNMASSFPNSNTNVEASSFYAATTNRPYQSGSLFPAPASNNQPSLNPTFGVGNMAPVQVDGQSQINTFSFNVTNLKNDSNAPPSSFDAKSGFDEALPSYNLSTDFNSPVSSMNLFTDNSASTVDGTCGVYSELSQLDAAMLESFQAKTFKMGEVPLIPPPRQLCCN